MDPFFTLLDAAAKDIEDFVTQVAAGIDYLAEVLIETVEEAAEQTIHTLETALETEIEPPFNELSEWLMQPLLELLAGIEQEIEDVASPLHQTFQPLINQHPACVGCQHYHGQVYGDTLLVCGMHPYGWEGETCPDHEAPSP